MNNIENQKVSSSFQMNVPQVTVQDGINQILKLLTRTIVSGRDLKNVPATFLWGAPGVGKSQMVREIASLLSNTVNKKVLVKDVRLLLFNPIDLRGIPVANDDKSKAIWLRPDVFDLDDSSDVINILFLDELSSAPASVQAAAYQITLDRRIGEHELPENTYVIAAGNRKGDNSVSNTMPKALANRMLHFDIVSEYNSWKVWAMENNINEKVIGFLQYKGMYLNNGLENKNDIAYASPRSWERVSDILNYITSDIDEAKLLISALIGIGVASEFIAYCKFYTIIPDVNEIFKGNIKEVPKSPDLLYTLVSALTTKFRECLIEGKDMTYGMEYSMSMPMDFSYIIYSNLLELVKKYDANVMVDETFENWTEMLSDKLAA